MDRPVLLQTDCRFFDDCTFRYDGLEMRGDGSSFALKFEPTTSFTYNFTATLRATTNGTASAALGLT